jgi:ribosomal protein L22
VQHIGKIVHDSEINIWGKKVMPETALVEQSLNSLIKNAKNNQEMIARSLEFFDVLYHKGEE